MRMLPARRGCALLLLAPALAACELQEVTTAAPDDFTVAEVVLEAGADSQFAYLHRGLGFGSVAVENANVRVIDEQSGAALQFARVSAERCVYPLPENGEVIGSCYGASAAVMPIRPGAAYRLDVKLANGGALTGRTRVPGAYAMVQPRAALCALLPDTPLELIWQRSEDTWAYDVEARFTDIFPHLVERGVVADTPNVPLRLDGLAITANDTTLLLPAELGLFDRFDAALHPILVAIAAGLPEGVNAQVVVAAADRNYVNWARGGSFNPSGLVRVPSVRGDGTGVFGSFTPARFQFRVTRQSGLPSCTVR